MRNRLTTVTVALLLASATIATAQTPPAPQPATAPGPTAPKLGAIDFGGLFGDTNGDPARYERYRDARDGVYSDFRFSRETGAYFVDARASHIGYRDQRYAVGFDSSKVRFKFLWDSLPLNYYYDAITPYTRGGGTMLLPDDLQRAAENRLVIGVPCAYAGPCTNAAAVASTLAAGSAYNSVAQRGIELQSKRDTAAFGLGLAATRDLDVNLSFTTASKSGEMPWSAAFAFNNADEFPLTLDHRTNDVSAGLEWTKAKGMFRVGWDGSWFNNDIQTLVWDNPIRLTDYTAGGTAPWDGSAYINGNGPAQGRMALAPSTSMNVVSATGLYKFARATSINGTLQFTNQSQDEALIPWTTNSVLNAAAPTGGFPHLAALPRTTAQAGVDAVNALMNFSSRPWRHFALQAKYRYNKRDVTTPSFDGTEWVRFDAVPEESEAGRSHQFDTTRQNFDASGTLSLTGYGAVRIGYGHEAYERHGRGFNDVGEHIFRLSYDVMSLARLQVRAGFDYGRRRGDGFILAGQDYETQLGGEQPGLRYYDEADRNRTRASVMVSVNPTDLIALYVQASHGKDRFLGDEFIPAGREQFGLLDQKFTNWNVGVSMNPNDRIAFGVNYGQDDFSSLQKSRNANPSPDAQWTDPTRNWTLDNDEKVNNFTLYLDLAQLADKADLRFGYDFSDSDNAFVHGGPRITSLAAANTFIPLPNVTNTWHRFTADLKYYFTPAVGVGIGYYFEKLDVFDYATIDANGSVAFRGETGTPRMDYLGALITGYALRPYDGQNAFVRLLYRF